MTGTTGPHDAADAPGRRLAPVLVPAAALAASLVVRLGWWWQRAYIQDDFMVLSWGWLRSLGKRPGVDTTLCLYTPLTEALAPLFRLFPDSFVAVDAARLYLLIAGLGLLLVSFRTARTLGASRSVALAAVSLASWQPDFQSRLADVRNDPFAALSLVGAASLLAGGAAPVAAGVAAGTAILFSVKYALAGPFLALAVVARDRARPVRSLLAFGAGAACAVSVFVLYRLVVDGPTFARPWIEYLGYSGIRAVGHPVRGMLLRSPLTFALLLAGAAGWLLDARRKGVGAARGAVYTVLAIGFVSAFAAINPFFYPHNLVMVVPVLVPVAVGLERLLPATAPARWRVALLVLMTAVPVLEGVGATVDVLARSNARQRRVLRWLWTATSRDERAFDSNGTHLFRDGIYDWYTYGGSLPAYWAGRAFSLEAELRAAPVHVVIWNDRLKWLTPEDQRFVQSRFVPAAPGECCILTPGSRFAAVKPGEAVRFEVVTPGLYEAWGPDGRRAGVKVDGAPLDGPRWLATGWHRVEVDGPSPVSELVLGLTTPRRRGVPLPCPEPEALFEY